MDLEPTIKYEHIDDVETNGDHDGANFQHLTTNVGHHSSKSPHTQIQDSSGGSGGRYGELIYNNPSKSALKLAYDRSRTRNMAALQQRRERQQNEHQQQINQKARRPFPKGPKTRFLRGDCYLLFAPPFFQLEHDYDSLSRGDTLSARCLQCNVPIRGHKNVSSNFIKHLKRMHPKIYLLYESLKLQKIMGRSEVIPYGSMEQVVSGATGDCNGKIINEITTQAINHNTNTSNSKAINHNTNTSNSGTIQNMEQQQSEVTTVAATNNLQADFTPENQEITTHCYSSPDNGQQLHVSSENNTEALRLAAPASAPTVPASQTPEVFEALIRRILDEKLQLKRVTRCKRSQQQKFNSREFITTIERNAMVVSPVPSSISSSSMSDTSSSISIQSDNSQQAELQEQLSNLQHDMRLLCRGQRRMQRQMIKMRKMLRRRTMILDVGKAKKHHNHNNINNKTK